MKEKTFLRKFKWFMSTAIVAILIAGITWTVLDGLQNKEFTGKINEVKGILDKNYYVKLDDNQLKMGALKGMVSSIGDKYTHYYTKEEWDKLNESFSGKFQGIGVNVKTAQDGSTYVEKVIDGAPAQKAGIKGGDIFYRVDENDVKGKGPNDVVPLIKNAQNDMISIIMYRPSEKKEMTFSVEKKTIVEDHVTSKMLQSQLGYLRVLEFDEHVFDDFSKHIKQLEKSGAKKLVIDLRDNPGGDMNQAVKMCDMLLPKCTVVYVQYNNDKKQYYYSDEKYDNIPFVVLVNGRSASASEIFSAAMQDNKRGQLIGTKTYGKGLVQRLQTLQDGSGLYYTIARYFTPNGVCIHGIGIQPNIVVDVSEEYKQEGKTSFDIPEKDDVQLQRAIEEINK